jgi:integral membrane sensor domain MASE1
MPTLETRMERAKKQGTGTRAKVAIALIAGLVVLVLLFPGSGISTLPPECFSAFGYTVPCEVWPAVAAGAATAVVVGLALWLKDGRR